MHTTVLDCETLNYVCNKMESAEVVPGRIITAQESRKQFYKANKIWVSMMPLR